MRCDLAAPLLGDLSTGDASVCAVYCVSAIYGTQVCYVEDLRMGCFVLRGRVAGSCLSASWGLGGACVRVLGVRVGWCSWGGRGSGGEDVVGGIRKMW